MAPLELLADWPALFIILAVLLGLIVGSFLNVVVYRLPLMMERDWRAQCAELLGQPAQDAGQPVLDPVGTAFAVPALRSFNSRPWKISRCSAMCGNAAAAPTAARPSASSIRWWKHRAASWLASSPGSSASAGRRRRRWSSPGFCWRPVSSTFAISCCPTI